MRLSDQVVDVVAQHDEIMNTRFPGIKIAQEGYYAVPKDQRKAYLQQFPKLTEYWDWNREYKKQHPEYAQWDKSRSDMYNERTMCNAYADMSERTQKELEYAKATGKQMSDIARYEVERLYQKYADPDYTSYGEFVQQLMDWE